MKKLILLLLMPIMLQGQNFRGLDESPMDQAKIHFGWEFVRFEVPFKVL